MVYYDLEGSNIGSNPSYKSYWIEKLYLKSAIGCKDRD